MSGPSEQRTSAPSAGGLLASVLVVLLVGLGVAVATLAASTGPTAVFSGAGPDPDRISVRPSESPTPAPVDEEDDTDDSILPSDGAGSLRVIGLIVRTLLVVLIVVALVLAAVFFLRRRRPRRAGSPLQLDEEPDFDVVDTLDAVSSALVEDAPEQDAALRAGSPRNGIVEAWLRFELQAARAGAGRRDWETSTEFTLRLLDALRADPAATARLAELYRVARFSDHEITEAEREDAAAALGRIREQLASRRERA